MGMPCSDMFFPDNTCKSAHFRSFHKTFSLLMPMVKPDRPQMYMYTTMKIRDEPIFITGLSPKVKFSLCWGIHKQFTNFSKRSRFVPLQALEHTLAHHMILLGCEVPVSTDKAWTSIDVFYHEKACIRGIHYIYGWSLDAPELILPQGVGIRQWCSVTPLSLLRYGMVPFFCWNGTKRVPFFNWWNGTKRTFWLDLLEL